jgi:hypothetical protein
LIQLLALWISLADDTSQIHKFQCVRVISALIRGHRQILHCTEAVGTVAFPSERDAAYEQLTDRKSVV